MTGFSLFLLLISPAVGSFLAVLVDRLPKGESLLRRSACDNCGTALKVRDLVPIVSALALKQQCRTCQTPIPGHLLRIEVAATIAAIAAILIGSDWVSIALYAAIFWCLITLFYCDMLHLRLPDALTATLFLLGLAFAQISPNKTLLTALASAAAGVAAFWMIRWIYFQWRGREGLGLGDVKLMAGIGALLGWQLLPIATLIAALMALAVAVVNQLRGIIEEDERLPFGSYLCAATLLMLLI